MAKYISLHKLLSTFRCMDTAIAQIGSVTKNWSDWLSDVSYAQHFFSSRKEKTWALYTDDTYEFLVLLFALWAEKKIACVPGSNQPAVIEALDSHVDGFVGLFSSSKNKLNKKPCLCFSEIKRTSPVHVHALDISLGNEGRLAIDLDLGVEVLQVFTSGSSGAPELISKSLSQLTEEINNIHHLWGENGQGAIVFSTVTHHHIYGLLFRALWPLAAGHSFDNHLSEFFEDVERRSTDLEKLIIVSSPTHLSRIPQNADWVGIKKKCSAIFSSGAPLPKAASLDARKHFGFSPIEVFGSSETGGIAWRQQKKEVEVNWMPFPNITVSIEEASQCLQVQSPYLPPQAKNEWFVTSDKIKFDESGHCFQLLGRVDNIVKVEGKRVSVTEMERKLKEHEWIADAKAVMLSGKRTEIGIVIVLTRRGVAVLNDLTRFQFNKTMRSYLLSYFERPVLPRRWRIVDDLPFNSQGKVTLKSLVDLFSNNEAGNS